jgi:hypothetical protein
LATTRFFVKRFFGNFKLLDLNFAEKRSRATIGVSDYRYVLKTPVMANYKFFPCHVLFRMLSHQPERLQSTIPPHFP